MPVDKITLRTLLDAIEYPLFIIDRNGLIQAMNSQSGILTNINAVISENMPIYELYPFSKVFQLANIIKIIETARYECIDFEDDIHNYKIEIYPLYINNQLDYLFLFIQSYKRNRSFPENDNNLTKLIRSPFEIITRYAIHDLNNIFATIQGNLTLLAYELHKRNIFLREVKELELGIERAVLSSSYFFSNKENEYKDRKHININDIIVKIVKQINWILENNVKVNLELSEGLWPIFANSHDIERIIENLIINSKEALPLGGVITIKSKNHYEKDDKSDKYVYLSIQDNGCGIEESIIHKIFEQSFSTKNQKERSRGLGLAIIDSIIKQLDGFIKIKSRVGEGSVFDIYIPVVSRAENQNEYDLTVAADSLIKSKVSYPPESARHMSSIIKDELIQNTDTNNFHKKSPNMNLGILLKDILELGILKNVQQYNNSIIKDKILKIDELFLLVNELNRNNSTLREIIFLCLIDLAKLRDTETGFHLNRIGKYSGIISWQLSFKEKYRAIIDNEFISNIYLSSQLHDIGKVGIPDRILLKKGTLNDDENKIMKTHTHLGGDILKKANKLIGETSFMSYAEQIAYYHHEKWDGSGYQQKLKAAEIPLSARIVALADAYDACTTERVYKKSYSHADALIIIEKEANSHFDPDIVEAFIYQEKEINKIRRTYLQ